MSVAIGIFTTYDDVLRSSGPVGIWLWPIAMAGQLLIALVYAQFAARIPLTGSSYQWGSRLASPKVGWVFGWLSVCGGGITVVAIDTALASQAFMPLFGLPPNEGTARLITLAALAIQVVIAIASTQIMSLINSAAVGLEFAIVIALGIALVVVVFATGTASTSNLTSLGIAEHATNYFGIGGGLMLAMLMGMTTLQGFEVGANMAEEAKAPFRSVPRAIVGSVIASGVLGMLFLIVLTVSIKDVPRRQRQRFRGGADHPRSTWSGGGAGAAGRHRLRVLRRRPGRHRDGCADRVRDGARRTTPRLPAAAANQPAHADPDPGDDPVFRHGGLPSAGPAG